MLFNRVSLFTFVLILFVQTAFAESGASDKGGEATSGGEEIAEGESAEGAEGEEKKEAGGSIEDGMMSREYTEPLIKMNTLKSKIEEYKKVIKASIKSKNMAKTSEERDQFIEQIKETHALYKDDLKKFNALEKIINLRFPNKGIDSKRKYMPLRSQSVNEIEDEMGIDSILTRVKNTVDRKYASFMKDENGESIVEVSKKQIDQQEKERKENQNKKLKLEF